ncbi:MAG: tetratricopeptide repeat protein [Candidatus Marinimicrobia bacterium]|nr:tetratricopeptide repeat protein [Candidatus Neomarinimicrobiota bacterium]
MNKNIFIIVSTISLLVSQDSNDEGLAHYKNKNFDGARSYYEQILTEDNDNEFAWFGLGVAAMEQGDLETANQAFTQVAIKDDNTLQSDAIYNLGHVAYKTQKVKESMSLFKKAISLNPDDMDAKYNYEFLLHQDQQNQQDQDSQPPPKPSEEAKRIKKEAEKLVEQRMYAEATSLMENLLKIDPTAASFQDYVQKIRDVYNLIAGVQ